MILNDEEMVALLGVELGRGLTEDQGSWRVTDGCSFYFFPSFCFLIFLLFGGQGGGEIGVP